MGRGEIGSSWVGSKCCRKDLEGAGEQQLISFHQGLVCRIELLRLEKTSEVSTPLCPQCHISVGLGHL